jgi:methionine-gamma-lyase
MRDKWDDSIDDHRLRPESLMMGYGYRPELSEGSMKAPVFQTSTFAFPTAEAGKHFFALAYGLEQLEEGEESGLIYSRMNNPDLEILEDRLTLWDDAETALVFNSGMAAITNTFLSHVRPGEVILHSGPLYGGTDHLVQITLPELGIRTIEFRPGESREAIESRLAAEAPDAPLRMVFLETPANPTNDLIDIGMCVAIARSHATGERDPLVAVDNTFLGPMWQRPLEHGADVILYSLTKFVGGHSDLIAGAAVGPKELLQPMRATRTFTGSQASPWTGWLLMRSLETLKLRMDRQAETAERIAPFLVEHPKVTSVRYLGLLGPGDPQHEIYKRQCLGPGSMISFEVDGGEAGAFRFLNALRLVHLAVSLGGTESLAEHPASFTHAGVSAEHKAQLGITPGLVRMSVGVEHYSDLLYDLDQALQAV